MPRREWRDGQSDWGGGANSVNDARQLAPNQFVSGNNLLIDTQGGLRRRGGFQRVSSSFPAADQYLGATSWVNHAGANEFITLAYNIGTTTTTLYKGGTTIPITLASSGTITPNGPPSVSNFVRMTDAAGNPCLYFASPDNSISAVNKYYKWSSTTATLSSLTPAVTANPGQLVVHNQRLFSIPVFSATGLADKLFWSGLNNGDTLGDTANGGGFTRIETAGGYICDAISVGASLIILHSNGFSRFTGWNADDIAVSTQTVTASAGLGVSRLRGAVSLGNVGYFVADSGLVYKIDEAGTYEVINQHFPLPTTVTGGPAQYQWRGVLHDRANQTLSWVSTGTFGVGANTLVNIYSYNYATDGWTTATSPQSILYVSNGMAALDTSPMYVTNLTSSGSLAFAVQQYGIAAKDDVLSDGSGGTNISAVLTTKKYVAKKYALTKALRFLYLEYNQAAPSTATVAVNGAALSNKAGGGQDTTTCWQSGTHGPAGSFQVVVTDSGLSATEKVSSLMLEGFEYTERF